MINYIITPPSSSRFKCTLWTFAEVNLAKSCKYILNNLAKSCKSTLKNLAKSCKREMIHKTSPNVQEFKYIEI